MDLLGIPQDVSAPIDGTVVDVLIAAGEGDPYSSPAQTQRLAEVLDTAGAAVSVHVEPRAGHGLGSGDLRALESWAAGLGVAGDGAGVGGPR